MVLLVKKAELCIELTESAATEILSPNEEIEQHQLAIRTRVQLWLSGFDERSPSLDLNLGPQVKVHRVTQGEKEIEWKQYEENGQLILTGLQPDDDGDVSFEIESDIDPTQKSTGGFRHIKQGSVEYIWTEVEPEGSTNLLPQGPAQGSHPITVQIRFDLPKEWMGRAVTDAFPIKPHHMGILMTRGFRTFSGKDGIEVLYPSDQRETAGQNLSVLAQAAKQVIQDFLGMDYPEDFDCTFALVPYFSHTAFEYPGLVLVDQTEGSPDIPGNILNLVALKIHELAHYYFGGQMPEESFEHLPLAEGLAELFGYMLSGKLMGDLRLRMPTPLFSRYPLEGGESAICNRLPYSEKNSTLTYQHSAGIFAAIFALIGETNLPGALRELIEARTNKPTTTQEACNILLGKVPLDDPTVLNHLKEGFRAWFFEKGKAPECTLNVSSTEGRIGVHFQQEASPFRLIVIEGLARDANGKALKTSIRDLKGGSLVNGKIVIWGEQASWELGSNKGESPAAYSLLRNSLLPIKIKEEQDPNAWAILVETDDDPIARLRALKNLLGASDQIDIETILVNAIEKAFKNLEGNSPYLLGDMLKLILQNANTPLVKKIAEAIEAPLKTYMKKKPALLPNEDGMQADALQESALQEIGMTYLLMAAPSTATDLLQIIKEDPDYSRKAMACAALCKSDQGKEAGEALIHLMELAKEVTPGPERDVRWVRIVTGIASLRLPWKELKTYFEMAQSSELWDKAKNVKAYKQLYFVFLSRNPERKNPEALEFIESSTSAMIEENPALIPLKRHTRALIDTNKQ